ncbi:MAG: complex I subunit 5 family protein [Verrucomicrobiales bacterium]
MALFLPVTRLAGFATKVLVPLAPLPALCLALFGPADGGAVFEWWMLGSRFGFGPAGQVFLLLTGALWLVAGIYGRGYLAEDPRGGRFHGFFLLTMAGNIGLILARDVPAFYTFFAVMTFAAYGLVIHADTPAARRAARIYLIAAVVGEALLLGAIFLAVQTAQSTRITDIGPAVAVSESRNLIMFLAFFGFGVKAGALPFHFWLPLAHPVAPAPASAVLSGAMIKAGLLGWLHFLPLGQGEFPAWSSFCIVAGLVAAFGAVVVGCAQTDSKTTLAYSSISQMGVMTAMVGVGLAGEEAWVVTLPVLLLYALNHGLAKGALFLGAGMAPSVGRSGIGRWVFVAGLAMAALAIAAAPWTGGAVAKDALKAAVNVVGAGASAPLVEWLGRLLPLTTAATSLLLGRFFWLEWRALRGERQGRLHPSMWLSWLILLLGLTVAVGFSTSRYGFDIPGFSASVPTIWKGLWPILLGLALLLVGRRLLAGKADRPAFPKGDVVVWFEGLAGWMRAWSREFPVPGPSHWHLNFAEPLERLAESERRSDFANRMERKLRYRSVAGVLFMLLLLAFVALLVFGSSAR